MKYIASWSGGKDSTASIILAHEHNEPLDLIIFSEVMFDENISGEFPEHIDFIKNKAIPKFKEWGYKTQVLHSDRNYLDFFYAYPTRGKWYGTGMRRGFPMAMKCSLNRDCKVKPIHNFKKGINEEITQYIGIAIDEPKRLLRINKQKNQISLLEKYNYTEQMAYELCEKYDLISPIYSFSKRGGCWFCPNARKEELKYLREHHRNLWNKLLTLENEPNLIGDKWNTLTKKSVNDMEQNFRDEERQISLFEELETEK